MKRTHAAIVLVVVSAALAVLLLTQAISSMVGTLVFAAALAVVGVLSRGFRD